MNTVLAVADPHPAHHFLVKGGAKLARRGWRLRTVPYSRIRDVPADGVRSAVLFFPHLGWDSEVELLPAQLYGSVAHGAALRELVVGAGEILRNRMPGITFLNTPEAIALTRDKGAVKSRWTAAGVPTPRQVQASTPAELTAAVAELGRVYVKAPCGSMNKGITVLTPQQWRTNFVFDDGVLRAPRPGDPQYEGSDRWSFADVDPTDERFLAALCAEPGLVMERGLADGVVAGRRVEARVTVLGGRVIDVAVAASPVGEPTTEPQVGSAQPRLPSEVGRRVRRVALRAAAALDLTYAVLDIVLDTDLSPMAIDAQAFPATRTPLSIFEAMLERLISTPPPARGAGSRTRASAPSRADQRDGGHGPDAGRDVRRARSQDRAQRVRGRPEHD
jgi:hypothetical protein